MSFLTVSQGDSFLLTISFHPVNALLFEPGFSLNRGFRLYDWLFVWLIVTMIDCHLIDCCSDWLDEITLIEYTETFLQFLINKTERFQKYRRRPKLMVII